MRRITVFDTTLRDGEQSPGASMNTQEKLVIARELLRLGVDVIEAGFPSSSPGDFESVARVAQLVGDNATVCALTRANDRDIEAAARSLEGAARPRVQTGIGVSDIHLSGKLGISREECLERIDHAVRYAKSLVGEVQFYAEDAGRSDYTFLCRALETAIAAGADVVNIPDTTGYSLPDEFGRRIAFCLAHTPGIADVGVSVHCHNDLGMATALTLAGVANGATQVECTINGLGERAGNCALEEIAMALAVHGEEMGVFTGLNTREFCRASRLVSSVTGLGVQANKAIVGANAFAHSSGIHQDGVIKDRRTYEILRPEDVGAEKTTIVLTARSGRRALDARLRELGYEFDAAEIDGLYADFVALADRKKEVYDEDLESIINERDRNIQAIYRLEGLQISTGFPLVPTATVTLRDDADVVHRAVEYGTGPIDAAYKAIDKVVKVEADLREFSVTSLTRGIDAVGEVTVRVSAGDGAIYNGRGSDADIIVSAAKAYLNALNRLLAARAAG